jgi:hypothetical protein
MILFRHAPPFRPFAWQSPDQPAGRWHAQGEGPATYLSTTPDAAWSELLRHEGIQHEDDLEGIDRWLWAIEVADPLVAASPGVERRLLDGGTETYEACQGAARRLRSEGHDALIAPSSAVIEGPSGFSSAVGLVPGPSLREDTLVLFGARPELVGWIAAGPGRPDSTVLPRVRHLPGVADR